MKRFNVVEAWLDNVAYAHSESAYTKSNYTRFLNKFCSMTDTTPEQIIRDYERMTDRVFRRRYAQYLRALIADMTHSGYASASITAAVVAVKSFFKYNDLPLAFVPVGQNKVTYHNRDITKSEVVQILKMSSPRDRAFFCMMAQSGLRPATLCGLKLKHVELDEVIKLGRAAEIEVPEEIAKGKYGAYFSFMGEESQSYLRSYLLTRRNIGPESWLFSLQGVEHKCNSKSMSGIFSRTVRIMKEKDLIDFELNTEGKPSEIRLYCLRKFFRKYASHAGVEYVNFWMGHKTDYKAPHIPASDVHYFSREDVEFQRRIYEEKAMPDLKLETFTPKEEIAQLKRLERELEKKDREIGELRNGMTKLEPLMEFVNGFENEEALQGFLNMIRNRSLNIVEFEGEKRLVVSLRAPKKLVSEFDETWRRMGFKDRDEAMQHLMKKAMSKTKQKS